MNWQQNLITENEHIRELLAGTRTIAVLGIKTEAQAGQPAFYVPKYMHNAGFEIIPVPVYYPEVTEILGQKVYRRLADVPFLLTWSTSFADRKTFRLISKTSSQRNPSQSGCNWGLAMMRLPKNSPKRESRWFRIVV